MLMLFLMLVMSSDAHRVVGRKVDPAQRFAEVAPYSGPVVPRAGEPSAATAADGSAGTERALEGVVAVVLERRRVSDPGVVRVRAVRPGLVMLLLLLLLLVMVVGMRMMLLVVVVASHGRAAKSE